MKKSAIRARDAVRLRDGRVMSLEAAYREGAIVIEEAWGLWQDETHGNILGLRPKWKRDRTRLFTEKPEGTLLEVYSARKGFEFRSVFLASAPDRQSDWGEIPASEARRLRTLAGSRQAACGTGSSGLD